MGIGPVSGIHCIGDSLHASSSDCERPCFQYCSGPSVRETASEKQETPQRTFMNTLRLLNYWETLQTNVAVFPRYWERHGIVHAYQNTAGALAGANKYGINLGV